MRIGVAWKPVAAWAHSSQRDGTQRDGTQQDLIVSGADAAALEWALRLAEVWGGDVVVVCVGPPALQDGLRQGLAAGATHGVRVDLGPDATSDVVAAALAEVGTRQQIEWWCCGERSLDRASGSVPAFLAAELGWASALGLVAIDPPRSTSVGRLEVERRLDRGRRERLAVAAPGVISVEAGTATLRRASLPRVLEAQRQAIEVPSAGALLSPTPGAGAVRVVQRQPYRPRAKELASPGAPTARERIAALTAVFDTAAHAPRRVVAPPGEAAAAIIDALHTWGYLQQPGGR